MRLFKQIAALVGWFCLWMATPAALLFPIAVWTQRHTRISEEWVEKGYLAGVCLLFFPAGFLVDFLYRRFIRDKRANRPPAVNQDPM
jgi:hypothetical protein